MSEREYSIDWQAFAFNERLEKIEAKINQICKHINWMAEYSCTGECAGNIKDLNGEVHSE